MNTEKQEQVKRDPALWGINEDVINRARHRGEQLTFKKGKPVKREYSGGLWWLYSRGRITKTQAEAGRLYGDCYERSKGTIKSQLDGSVHTGFVVNYGKETSIAAFALQGPIIALHYDKVAIGICNKICGEGYRIRELARDNKTGIVNRTQAISIETKLSTSLDVLAIHFGLVKTFSPLQT